MRAFSQSWFIVNLAHRSHDKISVLHERTRELTNLRRVRGIMKRFTSRTHRVGRKKTTKDYTKEAAMAYVTRAWSWL